VERAVKKGGFSRAFRATVRTPTAPVLMEAMVEALRRSIVQRLALARRAGALEIGAENVAAALKQGRGSLLILASDLSEGGRRKQEVNANRKELPVVGPVDSAALGGALGRDHAGVILVCAEPFAQDLYRLSLQVDTLSGYNTARPEPRG
jgi:ribosomal protein L7Ae-like RNA K-turn-binding protein